MSPSFTLIPPNQRTAIIDKFKISIINGINDPIKRFARVAMRETSKLALLKRTSSVFTLLKTRITRIPVKFSLITKFNLSIFFCIILNNGMVNLAITTIVTTIIGITIKIILDNSTSLRNAIINAPIMINGELNIIRIIIIVTI